jgi:hypothetical protein
MTGYIRTIVATGCMMLWLGGCDRPAAPPTAQPAQPGNQPAAASVLQAPPGMIALGLEYAKPQFIGTQNQKMPEDVEPLPERPRSPVFAPEGTLNLSRGRPVTASDASPARGTLDQITDGDKEGDEGSIVEFTTGRQWVQIDLGAAAQLHCILLWLYHREPRVYKDVVVQVSADADFIENVQTIFNNDRDNSSGHGIGTDREFIEHWEGKLIDGKSATGRFVRVWSNGNITDHQNHCTEVEVWGRPVE